MTRYVPRDYHTNAPIIETTNGVYVRVSYSLSVEGARRQAEQLSRVAERMGVKARYRVRGDHEEAVRGEVV